MVRFYFDNMKSIPSSSSRKSSISRESPHFNRVVELEDFDHLDLNNINSGMEVNSQIGERLIKNQ